MRKTETTSHDLVERLEKKYQKKARFQKYKSFTKHFRQNLSRVQGVPAAALENDDTVNMLYMHDYEYIDQYN